MIKSDLWKNNGTKQHSCFFFLRLRPNHVQYMRMEILQCCKTKRCLWVTRRIWIFSKVQLVLIWFQICIWWRIKTVERRLHRLVTNISWQSTFSHRKLLFGLSENVIKGRSHSLSIYTVFYLNKNWTSAASRLDYYFWMPRGNKRALEEKQGFLNPHHFCSFSLKHWTRGLTTSKFYF